MNQLKHINAALIEDDYRNDISTKLVPYVNKSSAILKSKESFYIYGLKWFQKVFKHVDKKTTISFLVKDGDYVKKNKILANIKGSNHSILKAERVALNYLQIMSGVYDICKQYNKKINNKHKIKILHTRKTPPLLKLPISEACTAAMCLPHRYSLSTSVLFKENHLKNIDDPKTLIRNAVKKHKKVVVEAKSLEFARKLAGLGIDRVLLDNFTPSMVKKFLSLKMNIKVEVSGSINLKNITSYVLHGVDYISIGSLTKDIKSKDLSILIQ